MNSSDFNLKSIVPIILFCGSAISLVVLIGMICNSKFNKSVGRVSVDATLVYAPTSPSSPSPSSPPPSSSN
jgi:hypothetical protein